MNPYDNFSDHHFWSKQVSNTALDMIDYDPAPKFKFDIEKDKFATAGSCFAQHFAKALVKLGGRYIVTETAHPLLDGKEDGYGTFSARYGNIYSTRQLREMLEQAFGKREQINDIAQNKAGRWVDQLRPRASKIGFSSQVEAIFDRKYHLEKVRDIFRDASVFVFTLGLTETWENTHGNYVYPMCPGTVAGNFEGDTHRFSNHSYNDVLENLERSIQLIKEVAPSMKILLTVSPVMLVATAEKRGALQSSIVSKSILRAAADHCSHTYDNVDYFPSFEIITGPQTRGQFFSQGARDVTQEGVSCVMGCFFKSRINGSSNAINVGRSSDQIPQAKVSEDISKAFEVDCDEILLDR